MVLSIEHTGASLGLVLCISLGGILLGLLALSYSSAILIHFDITDIS